MRMPGSRIPALALCALFLGPLWVAHARDSTSGVVNFLAADSYYYLTIAKQSHPVPTFDGTQPTNGFHPLWQGLLMLGVHAVPFRDPVTGPLHLDFFLGAAFALVGLLVLTRILADGTGSRLAPLFLVPGVATLFVQRTDLYSLVPWRIVNGLETSLEVLFLSLVVSTLYQHRGDRSDARGWSDRDLVRLGLLTGLLGLARLENLLLVPILVLALRHQELTRRRLVLLTGIPLLCGVAFVGLSLAGGLPPLPVSAIRKSGLAIGENSRVLVAYVLSFLGGGGVVSASKPELMRMQMLGPCLLLLLVAGWAIHHGRRRHELAWLLPVVLLGVCRLLTYLLLVDLVAQGFWYYLLPAVVVGFGVGCLILPHLRRSSTLLALAACLLLVVYLHDAGAVLAFSRDHRWTPHHLLAPEDRREVLDAMDRGEPGAGFVDMSDGIFAWFLDRPAISGTRLAADAAGVAAGGLTRYLGYCIHRGFCCALWSRSSDSGTVPESFVADRLRLLSDVDLIRLRIPRPGSAPNSDGETTSR